MTELQEQQKFILDATAGFRMMHFDKQNPYVLYLDQRAECEPEQVGDFKNTGLSDESFYLIVWDPPHLMHNPKHSANANMLRVYGSLEPETWQSELKDGFKELWRLLKPGGSLLFKWCTFEISSDRVLKLFPVKPVIYQISANKKNSYETGKRAREVQTMWFCFFKNPSTNPNKNLKGSLPQNI